jgi:ABC-type sugar transport system ATPase subunit
MSSIKLDGLTKRFGATPVLHPTTLHIADGEFVVVVGPSGCGKSTLLRLIAGLESPDEGRIRVGGRDVTGMEPAARGIAMVFQSYALYPHLSVHENIAFPLRIAKLPRAEADARVRAVAEMLDLSALLDRRPRALSGGQRQRVSIGRAIVREPGVLLLDEPLSNLDAALRVRMRHELARLHGRLGATMVYVTHDHVEAMTLAERIVVMEAGRIEQVGPPMEVYDRPASLAVARVIGSPAINLLPVTVESVDGEGAALRLPDGGLCRAAARVPAALAGGPATLGIRPEHLQPCEAGPFGGRVELFERLGPLSFAHLANGHDEALVAQLPSDRAVTLGEAIRFTVLPGQARLFGPDGRALAGA